MNQLIIPVTIIIIALLALGITAYQYSNAQLGNIEIIEDRKEYVYCPVDLDAFKTTSIEIHGCPTVRIYIEEYTKLDNTTKTDIDISLRNNGFLTKEELQLDESTGKIILDKAISR